MKLTISGLPADFDRYDLKDLFSAFGWVQFATVYIDPITLKSRRHGLVEMRDERQAMSAMNKLQGTEVRGHTITIKVAKEKKY